MMTSWAPADNSGGGLPLTVTNANYEQITSDSTEIQLNFAFPTNTDTNVAKISLPVSSVTGEFTALAIGSNSGSRPVFAQVFNSNVKFYADPNSTTALRNVDLSGVAFDIAGVYFTGS